MPTDPTVSKPKPTVGLVVGGRGLASAAALPLLRFLSDHGISVSAQAASGTGVLFLLLHELGYSDAEIEKLLSQNLSYRLFHVPDIGAIAAMAKLPWTSFSIDRALYSNRGLTQLVREWCGGARLEDFTTKTFIMLADLLQVTEIVCEQGLASEALLASILPWPLYPPVLMDEKWVVDGSYVSPLPIQPLVNHNIDVIIALHCLSLPSSDTLSLPGNFRRFLGNVSEELMKRQAVLAIDLHHHEILPLHCLYSREVYLWQHQEFPAIIETGEKLVEQHCQEILGAIRSHS